MKRADGVVYVVAKAPRPGSTKTRLCPPLSPDQAAQLAGAALAHGFDVVLGPAEDGGYYVLAGRAAHPWLFRDMRWSTDGVASETLRRCRALGLRTHILRTWYDVGDAASLDILRTDLLRLPAGTATHTRAVLKDLDNPTLRLGDAA